MTSAQHRSADFAILSSEEVAAVHGGATSVLVDGRTTATVDEFSLKHGDLQRKHWRSDDSVIH